MKYSFPEEVKRLARRALRWYGTHTPIDKGRYRLVNFWATRLAPEDADNALVTVRSPHGFLVTLDLREHIQQRAYYLGYSDPMFPQAFTRYVKTASAVVDLGANFGQFTLLAAQLVGPKGQVLAFEPAPRPFAALRRNVELNGFTQVICRQAAVSATAGTADFFISPLRDSGTSSLARAAVERYHSEMERVTVEVERLDDHLERLTCPVSLIKMDIQGAELPALQGAGQLIRRDRPILILEVDLVLSGVFGYTPGDLGAYLHDLGYRLYSMPVRPWQRPVLLDWREMKPLGNDIFCLPQPEEI